MSYGKQLQMRSEIERKMAHTICGWQGPRGETQNTHWAARERNLAITRRSGLPHVLAEPVLSMPRRTGCNLPLYLFDWIKNEFVEENAAFAKGVYHVEFERRGAVLRRYENGRAAQLELENLWVLLPQNAARIYYDDTYQSWMVARIYFEMAIRSYASKVWLFGKTSAYVDNAQYFFPLFVPDTEALPHRFRGQLGDISINEISASFAKEHATKSERNKAVYTLYGEINPGKAFELVLGYDPNANTPHPRYFTVELSQKLVDSRVILKRAYSLELTPHWFLRME